MAEDGGVVRRDQIHEGFLRLYANLSDMLLDTPGARMPLMPPEA